VLSLHINPILLCDTSLACRSFLPTKRLVKLVYPFGDLGFLACDLGAVIRPFVQQDACGVLEFGAGLLVLHEGGMLGAEGLDQTWDCIPCSRFFRVRSRLILLGDIDHLVQHDVEKDKPRASFLLPWVRPEVFCLSS